MDPAAPFEIEIDDLAFGGAGVGRREGKAVFVPGALPGERVRARTVAEHAAWTRAVLVEVLRPAPGRVDPACPLARRAESAPGAPAPPCPGCAYLHLRYEDEVAAKRSQLAQLLARIGRLPPAREIATTPALEPLGYRNKLVLHAQRRGDAAVLGLVADDNRSVVDLPDCPLAVPDLRARLRSLRADARFVSRLRDGARVTLRHTPRDGARHWVDRPPRDAPWLEEETPFGPVSVPAASFFQVNAGVSAALLAAVRAALEAARPAAAVDAYCGAGVLALAAAAAGVPRVVGVDRDGPAIRAARANARRSGATGIEFVAGDAAARLPALVASLRPGAVTAMVDPPRTGLAGGALAAVRAALPERLLYVSCAADTLARDLRELTAAGYVLERVRLFDMFPRTAEFETLAELARPAL